MSSGCMAFGVAGLSVIADSLSAIRYADVRPIRDENGLITDFRHRGRLSAVRQRRRPRRRYRPARFCTRCIAELCKTPAYRGADPHSVGADHHLQRRLRQKDRRDPRRAQNRVSPSPRAPTPCTAASTTARWRRSTRSRSCPMRTARDGISNTFSVIPDALGRTHDERTDNLVAILDGLFRPDAPTTSTSTC